MIENSLMGLGEQRHTSRLINVSRYNIICVLQVGICRDLLKYYSFHSPQSLTAAVLTARTAN